MPQTGSPPPAHPILFRALALSALAAAFIAILACVYLNLRIADERDKISMEETHHVQIQAAVLSTDLRFIAQILFFLHDQIQAHGLVETSADRVSFAHDMYSFMRNNDLFDQIRFIDASGMERLRVDAGADGPVIVPDQALQFKGDTYYFRKTMALTARDIYISPLDLNKEHGTIERPFKPVIRFGMKVLNTDGKPGGILIINHKAQDMLERYQQVSSPNNGLAMLLNARGYWLSHPDPKQAWGFMFTSGSDRTMAKTAPEIWAHIQQHESGQFDHQGSIISFDTVHPFAAFSSLRYLSQAEQHSKRYWKVVSQFTASSIEAVVAPIRLRVLLTTLLAVLLVSVLIVLILRARTNKTALLQQVQALSRELLQAREMERTDISRTLHDEFGQILTALQIQAELSDQHCQARDCTAAIDSIRKVEQFTVRLQNSTRSVLNQLKPAHLEELGLFEAVKDLCNEWQHQARFTVDFALQGEEQPLPEQLGIHLFRIVQEGLTNIARHSSATQASICFHFKAGHLLLSIEDNGCGLDIEHVVIGNGLTGMRERTQLIGGSMDIATIATGGTRLAFRIPIEQL